MTVTAKKTEFICMGCWGTFSPQPNTEGDVTCPHCGARQDLKHEPIDLDPEEFVDLGPELAAGAAAATTGPTAEGGRPARADDDDFDAVIEIDLDEIDANEAFVDNGQFTEPLPEPEPSATDVADTATSARPAPVEHATPQSHFYLRTERSHVYAFVSPDALVLWARRLRQSQKALQISLDGVDWQPFLPFLTRLAATGQISPEIQAELGEIERHGTDVSDDDLARSLAEEQQQFEVSAPLPAGEGAPAPAAARGGRGAKGAEKNPAPPPADTGPARGVGDFTFKFDERVEKPGLRYAIMLGVGAALGAGVVTVLALLGVLPPPPF